LTAPGARAVGVCAAKAAAASQGPGRPFCDFEVCDGARLVLAVSSGLEYRNGS
jgi:hypothetical protein